jgi:CO/xanthine dehydrogenase Mo-binding subunit
MSRRDVLQGSSGVGIGLSLAGTVRTGGAIPASEQDRARPDRTERDRSGATVASWLELDADGNLTVYAGKVELGTGVQTALAQLVAEELDLPFERVRLVLGDTALTPDQGITAGSKTIQTAGPILRQAAATARAILTRRAADRLGVPAADLWRRNGAFGVAGDETRTVTYGELATEPFDQPLADDAPLKPSSDYTVVGRSVPRLDLLAKFTGGEAFVHDLRLDGMLHGRVIRPHVRTQTGVGATVLAIDERDAREVPGLVAVVARGNFVGVVAEREEQAIEAARRLRVTWSDPTRLPDQAQFFNLMREQPVETQEVVRDGEVDDAFAAATMTHRATYALPYQAHAAMGPSCAVADVRSDGATIYSSSQGVYGLGAALADVLAMDRDAVRVIHREGAGCYGHNGADDVAADAALLSQAVGRPVRVQWERGDEFAWEPKGPAMLTDLRAGLDAAGNVVAWDYQVWTPPHSTRPNGDAGRLLAGELLDPPLTPAPARRGGGDRNAATNYAFPHQRVAVHWLDSSPLRQSSLRSLGGLHNTTANERFMDELAALAGADPVEFRLRHLTDPRAIDVIRRAADVAGWQTRPSGPRADQTAPAADGRRIGRGIAFVRYETRFAYAAVVAEVAVDPASGEVRVTRVVVAHDCGLVVNPDGVINQVEGNVIQGISRALKEEVTWDETRVTSLDWGSYPILTFAETPRIEVALIDRPEEPPLGSGEPAICPTIAAVGNAIHDATGAWLRRAPYTPARVLGALSECRMPNA